MAVKVGKALPLTDKELDKLAEITEEDIERTNKRWAALAPKAFANILLAEEE